MLVLLETAAGYALFRLKNKKIIEIENVEEIFEFFRTANKSLENLGLHAFCRFKDNKQAIEEIIHIIDGKLTKYLYKFLKKNIHKQGGGGEGGEDGEGIKETLIVADKNLANNIKKQLNINVLFSPSCYEVIRGIKLHLSSLITGLDDQDRHKMSMCLSHGLNRFKLRFTPDKLDTMIIQAIGLLEELDKELNNFIMRIKEWYGWHFPELNKIIHDSLLYCKIIQLIQFRSNAKYAPLETLLPHEICEEIRLSAETSMGTDITKEDINYINNLCIRIEELINYKINLNEYIKQRMRSIAPNLTYMVGEIIGARLLAHCGSLLSLSKQPASTIQILGAEKALFRSLKTKTNTPKYGIIYHASLVSQATPKLKGKISRVLAAKLSLCVRVDALTEAAAAAAGGGAAAAAAKATDPAAAAAAAAAAAPAEPTVAIACKRYVENRLELLEQQLSGSGPRPSSKPSYQRYTPNREIINGGIKKYDVSTDAVDTPQGVYAPNNNNNNNNNKEKNKKRNKEERGGGNKDNYITNGQEEQEGEEEGGEQEEQIPKKKKKIKTEHNY